MNRTNTTHTTTFHLPAPYAAGITFPSDLPTTPGPIVFAIPERQGAWRMPFHWHWPDVNSGDSQSSNIKGKYGIDQRTKPRERIESYEGSMVIGFLFPYRDVSGVYIGDGLRREFPRDAMLSWKSLKPRRTIVPGDSKSQQQQRGPLTVALFTIDHALWRNVCSAVLDGDLYPKLASTPRLVRWLFSILEAVRPAWHAALLRFMLSIQITAIFTAHNLHVNYGCVNATWPFLAVPWPDRRPPKWAIPVRDGSRIFIAWLVMHGLSLLARLFLGMRGEYEEYTPQRASEKDGME